MIKIEIILSDGRKIPAKISQRHYRRLTAKIEQMSFVQKIKVLFLKGK